MKETLRMSAIRIGTALAMPVLGLLAACATVTTRKDNEVASLIDQLLTPLAK